MVPMIVVVYLATVSIPLAAASSSSFAAFLPASIQVAS